MPPPRIEILTYEFLQGQLQAFSSDDRLPILVVDISKIPGGKDQPTQRAPLKDLIDAITHQGAKAIAIDVDFSPNEAGWITDDDPEFFDYCLQIKKENHVPIFLGVYRTRDQPADTWLGLKKYKELAVAAGVAKDITRMPRWIQAEGVPDRLPTMSAALAEAYQGSLPGPPKWLAWAMEMDADDQHGVERQIGDQSRDAETLVNYSKLEQIQHETVYTISRASVEETGELFLGKMVILGAANQFTDPFNVPGREQPVGGVYLEACAAYTLALDPLYELKYSVRLVLDFAISLLIILTVAWMRLRNIKEGDRFPWHKWQARFIYGAVITVLVAGILLVRWLSVVWLDFFLVIFALLLHPSVERWSNHLWRRPEDKNRH